MSGLYANKFTIETNDVARIVFVDERPAKAKGLPMPSVTTAEIVMTIANLRALHTALGIALSKLPPLE